MTCIVGLVYDDKVYIGGDSASVRGWHVTKVVHAKVFRVQDFLIGYTTSFRMGQILEYHLTVPEQNGQSDLKYLVTELIAKVRNCFKEHWFNNIQNEDDKGGVFLLGYHSHLYRIDADFQINECADGFDACGCGEDYAIGAMAVLDHLSPEKRIGQSLEVAARFNGAVCGPFHILSI